MNKINGQWVIYNIPRITALHGKSSLKQLYIVKCFTL